MLFMIINWENWLIGVYVLRILYMIWRMYRDVLLSMRRTLQFLIPVVSSINILIFGRQPCSIVTREYPQEWDRTKEAFYPVDNESNRNLYLRYKELNSRMNPKISLGGRLGDYRYYNMDEVIKKALEFELIKKIL